MYAIYSTTLYKICKCIKLLNKRAQGSSEEISLLCSLSSKANGKGKPSDYANHMSMSKSSLSNKMKRGSYTAKDLIELSEMTGNRLAIVDENDKVIIEFSKEDL